MITGPDLHRLRHNLQVAADEAQMKSGAMREVLLVSLQEAKDILDALSELVDRRAEPLLSRGVLDGIRNRALELQQWQAEVDTNVSAILSLLSREDE